MNIDLIEIGASEAARPLGLSSYETPLAFYARKTRKADPREETEPQRLGRLFEPVLATLFEREWDVPLHKCETVFHPTLGWLRATGDYFFKAEDAPTKLRDEMNLDDGERVLVEIKTSGISGYFDKEKIAAEWGEPGGDHIPVEYATQVQTQINVTNEVLQIVGDGFCTRAMVQTLLGGRGTPTFRVIGRPDLQSWILGKLTHFVEHHLVAEIPPPPHDLEDYEIAEEMIRKPMKAKTTRQANAEETALVSTWRFLRAAREAAELAEADSRNKLISAIQSSYGLEGEWGRVLYTAGKETQKTAKAAAFDAIMAIADKTKAPWAEAICQIRDDFTKSTHTGRSLRPYWNDAKKGDGNK